ncbi:type I restriction enzyme S subunit [Tahibacter aquaticus]|uniref:Type I restriction enzyme S subunit n=1 Tax=Tahibacter aquaticus TaxID=520092 RepID=A0A4R6Z6P4_9GAMM|nr:restriction endonuclease subunit S [Tahibacter aquaticus]TDR47374.1 type I restriction enzyme S subunit [Tahibacter aquaticus]
MSWTPKTLGEILEQSGRHRAGDQDLPVLSITMKHGLVDQADKFKKRIASSDTSNYRVAYKNELVVGFPIDEGVLGFQTKYPAGIVSPAYDIWKLRSEVDSHIPYLERYLRSAQARGSYASRMQGAVARRRSLTKTDFLNLEIPFPPLHDQIRIAHLLGKMEGLIAQRKQHLQQLNDLLKSVFLEMFGECVKDEDSYQPIVGVCDFIDYRGKTPPRVESGIPLISAKCVRRGYFDAARLDFVSDETYRNSMTRGFPKANDVLFTTEGATFGYTCRIPREFQKFAVGQRLITLVCKSGYQPEVLEFVLNDLHIQKKLNSRLSGSAALGIRSAELAKIVIPFPPPEAQIQFSAVVERVEGIKSLYQQSLTCLEALYGVLSQRAFKGELDLSRVALPAAPIEGESPLAAAVPAPITTPVIELPETDLLLPALQDRTQLAPLLRFWLEAYRTQLGGAAFSLERFIAAAQTRLGELHPDNDFELRASDYEHVKGWVFKALDSGRLRQERNQVYCVIETKETVLGNLIEIKAIQT